MFTPPGCASLAMFSNEDTEPDARMTVARLAALSQLHQSIAQYGTQGVRGPPVGPSRLWDRQQPVGQSGLFQPMHCHERRPRLGQMQRSPPEAALRLTLLILALPLNPMVPSEAMTEYVN